MNKFLGGSDVGFAIPGLGVFAGPNLTPDKETGLGNWTEDQIITAFTTGKRPDGRIPAPIMPYKALAGAAASRMAISAYSWTLWQHASQRNINLPHAVAMHASMTEKAKSAQIAIVAA
jgi:hypothetical protein